MKKYEWWKVLLLSFVTCGIYGIIWWYKMVEGHNAEAEKLGVEKIQGYIIALLLGIITANIYTYIWMYKYYDQNVKLLKAKGQTPNPSDNPVVLMLITAFVPVYSTIVACDNHNKLV